jgi:hypothetical protein
MNNGDKSYVADVRRPTCATFEEPEKVLVYLGPSLPLAEARKILPHAIYKPPCKQADIVTDLVNLNPTRLLLGDGVFRENLSPWHKELGYAVQYPGVKGVYGFSSMGALRAAELEWIGMIGIGKIFCWYRDGVTEDDSEAAVSFAMREGPDGPLYYPSTVPLVNIRAGVEALEPEFAEEGRQFLEEMRGVFYMDRTPELCEKMWSGRLNRSFPHIDQKMIDARTALSDFMMYEAAPLKKPTPDNLSRFFYALYERDRRINVAGTEIPQQHVDGYTLLNHPEYERICWDSANQDLALMLCDHLCVTVGFGEVERENVRFQQRSGIETQADFQLFLENNGWSRHEYDRLMIQNARIRKLQHANTVAKMYRRNTQQIIDYLRTYQAFDYWALQAVAAEKRIQASGVDDWLGVDLKNTAFELLTEHFEREGLELKCLPEEYLLETGFSNLLELSIALRRISALKEED